MLVIVYRDVIQNKLFNNIELKEKVPKSTYYTV